MTHHDKAKKTKESDTVKQPLRSMNDLRHAFRATPKPYGLTAANEHKINNKRVTYLDVMLAHAVPVCHP